MRFPSRRILFGFLSTVLASILILTACSGPEGPPRVLRLGELLPGGAGSGSAGNPEETARPASATLLAEDLALPVGTPVDLPFESGLDAARLARLELRLSGEARTLEVTWKLLGDRRFEPYRKLSVALEGEVDAGEAGDGEVESGAPQARLYEVDLRREPYWTGRVQALRLVAVGGDGHLEELTAHDADSPYRDISLGGTSLPSLSGLERRVIPFDGETPGKALFETSLGLVPEFDKPGVEVRFVARLESPDGEATGEPWLEETLRGGEAGGGGDGEDEGRWRRVSRQVTIPVGSRLVLETHGSRHGQPLPEGVGFWGAPMLLEAGAGRRGERAGPNLVVILIDTLRADVLGSYGSPDGLTPRLDALAGEGVRLAALHAPAPWTLPSVATLMTGLPPQVHRTGIRVGEFAPTALPEAADTLAEVLAREGFVTSGIYNNIYVNPAFRLHQGFDRWTWKEAEDDVLADLALEELGALAALGDQRFFFYLHLFGPHNPYEPPAAECDGVAGRIAARPAGLEAPCHADRRPGLPLPPRPHWTWIEALYRAEVAFTDHQVGRVLDGLEELGLADDTVVLVVSDHGEGFWIHLEQMRAGGYRAVSDHGHNQYRELLEVPGILRAPGLPAGRVVEDPVELADLYPTLLELLEVGAPAGDDGESLVPALRGEGRPSRRLLVSDNILHGPPRWAVRRGPWKLVVPEATAAEAVASEGDPEGGDGGTPGLELYHLDRDPLELTNLADQEPQVVADLLELGRREIAARKARALGDDAAATYLEWNHITKLRSLGYLQ